MGRHKPGLLVGGRPIIERVLDAVAGWPVVVVGSAKGVAPGTRVVSEEPVLITIQPGERKPDPPDPEP